MGGWGSGKGFRFSRGSRRKRLYIHNQPALNAKELPPPRGDSYDLSSFASTLNVSKLNVIWHCSPTGGKWFTLQCPICRKGRFKLMLISGFLACRCCFNLAYWSENRGKADRPIDQKWKWIHKIARGEGASEYSPRPKGMHRETYEYIQKRVEHYDHEALMSFFRGSPYAL